MTSHLLAAYSKLVENFESAASTRCSGDNKEILSRNIRSEYVSDFCHDREFALRLADIAKQNWKSDTDAQAKLLSNGEVKSLLEPEKHLKEIDNYFVHRQTVKFRISDHSLMIEKGRHHGMLREDRICKQCDNRSSKMSSISCLFVPNTRIYMNSICLNITPITRTLGKLLIFSTPTMVPLYLQKPNA